MRRRVKFKFAKNISVAGPPPGSRIGSWVTRDEKLAEYYETIMRQPYKNRHLTFGEILTSRMGWNGGLSAVSF